jgi:AcrR family transcriptional regulator
MDQRRRRGELTRGALVAAALRLVAEQGWEATTVKDIATEAGVSPRTFFHHFDTKEDVLFEGYADRLARASAAFRAVDPAAPLHQALEAAALSVVDSVLAQPELFLERAALYRTVPALRSVMLTLNDEWTDNLAREIECRPMGPAVGPTEAHLAATLVNGANRTALDAWSSTGGSADLRALERRCLDAIRPALVHIETTAVPRRRAG